MARRPNGQDPVGERQPHSDRVGRGKFAHLILPVHIPVAAAIARRRGKAAATGRAAAQRGCPAARPAHRHANFQRAPAALLL